MARDAENSDGEPESPQYAVLSRVASPSSFAVDNAFQRACVRCGVRPEDLLGRSLDEFRSPGLPDDVAVRRFTHFQNARIRKLYLVATERQRILTSEEHREKVSPPRRRESTTPLIPHPPTSGTIQDRGSSRPPEPDDTDEMLQRALHQRQVWDTVNARVQRSRQHLEHQRQQNAIRAKEVADANQQLQAAEEGQRRALHAINQHQMRKRWERDDRLAVIRQARLDTEFDARMKQHTAHMSEVAAAREARMKVLMEKARTGSPNDTQHRLSKARERKEQEDAACRAKGESAVRRVAERRKRHAVERFVNHARLSERALRERRHANEVIRRARQRLRERLQRTLEYMDNEELRGMAVLEQQEELRQQKIQALAQSREENHEQAKTLREQKAAEVEKERQRQEAAKAEEAEARARRQEVEEALREADAEARQQHREFILTRVVRMTEVRQEEAMQKHDRAQSHADRRMKKLHEIRSLLTR